MSRNMRGIYVYDVRWLMLIVRRASKDCKKVAIVYTKEDDREGRK